MSITTAHILITKDIGLIRDSPKHPPQAYEACLMVSQYGAASQLDLKAFHHSLRDSVVTLDTCNFEPGTVVYYLVKLPKSSITPRPLTRTSISPYWLNVAKRFDLLSDAREAFAKCKNH